MNFRPETRLDRAPRSCSSCQVADVAFSQEWVKISPRASTSTRLPVGDSDMFLMRVVTSFQFGIIQGKSPRRYVDDMFFAALGQFVQ